MYIYIYIYIYITTEKNWKYLQCEFKSQTTIARWFLHLHLLLREKSSMEAFRYQGMPPLQLGEGEGVKMYARGGSEIFNFGGGVGLYRGGGNFVWRGSNNFEVKIKTA